MELSEMQEFVPSRHSKYSGREISHSTVILDLLAEVESVEKPRIFCEPKKGMQFSNLYHFICKMEIIIYLPYKAVLRI